MDKGSAVLIADRPVQRPRPALPQLRLLTELEPRHRVFLDNLTDLILARQVPQVRTTTQPAAFWNDVFVPADAPWSSFIESLLLHLLVVVLFIWGQSRVWDSVKLLPDREVVRRSITYYPPKSYRAAESRAPKARPRATSPRPVHPQTRQAARQSAPQRPIPVTPERKPSLVTPPDIKQATARMPKLPDAHTVTPIVPFTATAETRRQGLAGPSGAVAPPPKVDQATGRRMGMGLPAAAAVAPAPELAGADAKRALKGGAVEGVRVVPPPPSVQNGNPANEGRLNSLAGPQVVPPPPAVQRSPAGVGRVNSLPGAGSKVVPPPPSVQTAGSVVGGRRLATIANTGPQVVPPAPSVQSAGSSGRTGRLNSSGAGPGVVPPPPPVQTAGDFAAGGRLGKIAGTGAQVVPPPPSVQGSGATRGTRLGSLSGGGAEVVPPPPPVQEARNSGAGGRGRSLSGGGAGDGSQYVAPPPAVQGAGNIGGGGTGKILEPMDPLPMPDSADASSNAASAAANQMTIEELPMGLLGLVFAAPGSSVYSNFEVFVAKRRVGKEKDQFQLIKLVYEFLPYQKRLSEYDLNNQPQRVIKLKVTPDPNCNEALGQILQPQSDPNVPITEYPNVPAALRSYDLSAVLPCYHITADEFQKAMSRAR
jgi:hypothetical protein